FIRASLDACDCQEASSQRRHRMRLHASARLTLHGRRRLVRQVCDEQVALVAASAAAGVSARTAAKWVARWRGEGEAGLLDRSSAAHRIPHRTPEDRVLAIVALRRLRLSGAEIAELLAMPLSTVSAILARVGLGKRS